MRHDTSKFVRFVVGPDGADHRYLNGVITEARLLRDDGFLTDHESELLAEVFTWFNENVPVPPYSKNKWWPKGVAAWFKDDVASEITSKIWDLVAFLREHGKNVRILRSRNPGEVYYEDEVQIVVSEFPRL